MRSLAFVPEHRCVRVRSHSHCSPFLIANAPALVGKLVKSYGAGWEEDVADLLRSDMKSESIGLALLQHGS